MTSADHPLPNPLDRFIHDYMLFLDGEGDRPDVDDLDVELRVEARSRIRLLNVLRRGHDELPAGAADRIALRFGFDRSGTRINISGPKFKRARKRACLELKDIAAATVAAGAPIKTNNLLRIEMAKSTPVEQPIVTALVAILHISVDDIQEDLGDDVSTVRAKLASPRFEQMITDWSAEHGRDIRETRSFVHAQVLATKYRQKDVTEDHLADIVRAILLSLER